MKVTVAFTPEQAAGLLRFSDKVTRDMAMSVLYPHVRAEIRDEQAWAILEAFSGLMHALTEAGVRDWPWIDSGRVE